MTVLCITSNKLQQLMNRERLDLYEAMAKQGAVIHNIEEQNNCGDNLPSLLEHYARQGQNIQAIIFEEISWLIKLDFKLDFQNANDVHIPIASFMTDFWMYSDELEKHINKLNISSLIFAHDAGYGYLKNRFPQIRHLIFSPFCIRTENFTPGKTEKTIDVLNTNGTHPVTPFRNRLYDLLPALNERDVNFYQLEHPGKRKQDEKTDRLQESYIDLLHKSCFVIADTTMYNLSVRKYYEIMAAGSTVLGNETGYPEHANVRKNYVCIKESMSDEEILSTICEAVKAKETYNKKALELSAEARHKFGMETIAKNLIANLLASNLQHTSGIIIRPHELEQIERQKKKKAVDQLKKKVLAWRK
ncbi:MAG: hypothetical protein KDI13_09880 [Alphaproteobacteria bacterium]|nr:hypothetical protein [Alphaproteobacteria bacterium]